MKTDTRSKSTPQGEGQFSGKVALVTGGGSGIGRAATLLFARDGARVAVADINDAGSEETVRMIEKAGGEGFVVHADVSKAADVEAMVRATVKRFGRLDFAFNNAGIGGKGVTTVEHTEEDFDRTIAINVKGVWLGMKYEILQMLAQGGPSAGLRTGYAIVNTSSIRGVGAFPRLAAYVASKHAVMGLTKVAALEYGKLGIRVNAVCPGVTVTPANERFWAQSPREKEDRIKVQPVGRFGQPEEIAAAAVWLCSDKASYVNGHGMIVDGGFVAQ